MVDEVAYDIIALYETTPQEEIVAQMLAKYGHRDDVDEGEILDCLADIQALKQAGKLFSQDLWKDVEQEAFQHTKPVLKAMCLHVAHTCNLNCDYCFASQGNYHGDRGLMPFAVGKQALDFLIASSGSRVNLEVDFFGGEPLMNWQVVKDLVAYARTQEPIHHKKFRFTLTTNGMLLDDEVTAFCNREMHNVVLSLDGRREIHDALRPTANGKGSFDLIAPRAQELVRRRGDKEHYVRGTFTNRNLDFTNDVRALREMGFEQISLEPVVLPDESPYAIRAEHVETVLAEYDKLASFLLSERKAGRWFNFFHFMVDLAGGPCLKKRVSGCGAGAEYVAVSPDGDIFPCHQFVGEAEWKMGSVLSGEFNTGMQQDFLSCNILTKPECRACWAKYFCSGGCAANAWKYNGDIRKPYRATCEFEKKRTECALGIFAAERES